MVKPLVFIVFLFTCIVACEGVNDRRVEQIDSLCNSIDNRKDLQESIGDGKIFTTYWLNDGKDLYRFKREKVAVDQFESESFYYQNKKLVKWTKTTSDRSSNGTHGTQEMSVYFDNDSLVASNGQMDPKHLLFQAKRYHTGFFRIRNILKKKE